MQELDAPATTNSLREIEDIALDLDKAIEASHIDHRKLGELKTRYQKHVELLAQGAQKNDSRFYIIDETAGLFSWIEGNKDLATEQVATAVTKKGDIQLTSHAARGLASAIGMKANTLVEKNEKGPIHGWLGFFHIVVSLVAALSLLITVLGTFGTLASPTADLLSWVTLLAFVAMSILSVSYLVFALRGSHRAIPVAIALFILLTVFCIALLIGAVTAESYDYDPSVRTFTVLTLLFLIGCGISTAMYYARSLKVRRAFRR